MLRLAEAAKNGRQVAASSSFFGACLELTDSQDNGLDDSSFGWNAKY
jgi:hypothetical protein